MISRRLWVLALATSVLSPLPAQHDMSRSFSSRTTIYGTVLFEDGSPVDEPAQVSLTCSGAVVQQVFTKPGGAFLFQLGDNRNPTTTSEETVGSPVGGYGNFNRMGRGLSDSGQFGSGRTSKAGRVNMNDCEISASLSGFTSDILQLGTMDAMENPNVGSLILTRRGGREGSTVSATSLSVPEDAQKAYTKAREEMGKKKVDWRKASALLEKAITLHPEYSVAWYLLGTCRAAQGEPARAYEAYRRAITADSNYLLPYLGIAELHLQSGNASDALTISATILKDHPQLSRAAYIHGFAAYSLGHLDAAEKSITAVQNGQEAAAYPGTHYLLGMVSAQRGDFEKAQQELTEFLRLSPTSPQGEEVQGLLKSWKKEGLVTASAR